MPDINEITDVMKIIQPIVWIIDTSASMAGERGELIKHILVEYEKLLKTKQSDDVEYRTGVLTFNTDFRWMNGGELIPADMDIAYSLTLSPEGMTNIGAALNELNNMLSREGLFKAIRMSISSTTGVPIVSLDITTEQLDFPPLCSGP